MKQDYNQFEIACNLNKCKYEKMQEFLISDGCEYTSLFISIDTIIRDYLMMTRDMVRDEITAEKIVSEILETAAHYKRFFRRYDKANYHFYIFLYNDMGYKNELISNPVYKQVEESPRFKEILKEMDILLSQICRYIPCMYYTNVDNGNYPGAVIPYQIIKSMNTSIFTRNSKMRSLIVSSNPFDYISLFLRAEGFHDIFAYRRKSDLLLDYSNIYPDFIFKYKARKRPSVNINSIYFYPRIILTRPDISRVKISEDTLKKYRKLILDFVFREVLSDDTSFQVEIDRNVSEFEALNDEISTLITAFDTPSVYVNKINELVRSRRIWGVDCVDFNIDELNNTFFRQNKVDFAALF